MDDGKSSKCVDGGFNISALVVYSILCLRYFEFILATSMLRSRCCDLGVVISAL